MPINKMKAPNTYPPAFRAAVAAGLGERLIQAYHSEKKCLLEQKRFQVFRRALRHFTGDGLAVQEANFVMRTEIRRKTDGMWELWLKVKPRPIELDAAIDALGRRLLG